VITRASHYGGARQITLSGADTLVSFTAAALWDITPDTSGRVVRLTDARKLCETVGRPMALVNRGTDTIEVQDFDGTQLEAALGDDEGMLIYLADCSTSAGHWTYSKHSVGYVDNPVLPEHIYFFGGRRAASGSTTPYDTETHKYDPQLLVWTTETAMTTSRTDAAGSFVIGTVGYIGGGYGAGNGDELDEYDPDVWTSRAVTIEETREHSGCTLDDGTNGDEGYFFHGLSESGGGFYEDSTDIYEGPSTDVWRSGLDQAAAYGGRERASSVAIGGDGYHMGGSPFGTVTIEDGANEKLDPVTPAWSTLTAVPQGRVRMQVAAVSTNAYMPGGSTSTNTSADRSWETTDIYSTTGDSWSTGSDLNRGKSVSHAVSETNGIIYVSGGETADASPDGVGPASRVDSYDPATDTWSTETDIGDDRYELSNHGATIQA